MTMEDLLHGGHFRTVLDEQIVFSRLDQEDEAVWSLLFASGYLKAVHTESDAESGETKYDLELTNAEVRGMFRQMIRDWFGVCRPVNNAFLQAMISGDLESMNEYMNDISYAMFSSFDTGKNPSGREEPERFYHGFVLGMMVELQNRYAVSSNRESGLDRYDMMLEPKKAEGDAFISGF